MAGFDLDELIRQELNKEQEPDPYVIARRLVMRVPDEHLRSALALCLGDRVALEVAHERGDILPAGLERER